MRRRLRTIFCLLGSAVSLVLVLTHLLGPLHTSLHTSASYINRMLTESAPTQAAPLCQKVTLASSGLALTPGGGGQQLVAVGAPARELPAKLRLPNLNEFSAPHFPRLLSEFEHELSLELLSSLTRMLDDSAITFMLTHNALLGSYMMHDLLPWDGSLQLHVCYRDLANLKRLFRHKPLREKYCLSSFRSSQTINEYSLQELTRIPKDAFDRQYFTFKFGTEVDRLLLHSFKFYYCDTIVPDRPMWPYVHVMYYDQNRTHAWTLDGVPITLLLDDIYPMGLRPLHHLWLPVPYRVDRFLAARYGDFRCARAEESARTAGTRRQVCCHTLLEYYPFVWRVPYGNQTRELLVRNATIVQDILFPTTFVSNFGYLPQTSDSSRLNDVIATGT